ncbi:Ig-like domain-containing protein [Marinobacteraceae bacterium S3BR75-40.1]
MKACKPLYLVGGLLLTSTQTFAADTYTRITTPQDGSGFAPGSTISVKVDAQDPDGLNVARLWIDNTYYSIDRTAPFDFTVKNLTEGEHELMVRTKDRDGNALDSAPITLSVGAIAPSYTRITAPADGTTLTPGEPFQVTAEAFDPEGIGATRLWIDGSYHSLDTDAPYTFTVDGLAAGEHRLMVRSRDTNGDAIDSPDVTVSVQPGSTGTVRTLEKRISSGMDDVEERAGGNMYTDSSDIELVYDNNGDQTVGLRFTGIEVPQGATITRAWVQFTADETNSEATSLTLRGEDTDSASPFSDADNNVSVRRQTAAATYWQPAAWNDSGAATRDQRTPDIAPVIQEIVSRDGWRAGNPLALIINGSGERTAESYEGSASDAALLHIEYSEGAGDSGGDSGGASGGDLNHVGSTSDYDNDGRLDLDVPGSARDGDLLMLFVSRTDDLLPIHLDGWTAGASCFKSTNGQDDCFEIPQCIEPDGDYCLRFDGGRGRDLATVVFYREVRSGDPRRYALNLRGDKAGWAILTALRGADTRNPIRDVATESDDHNSDSLFPSVDGRAGDMLLLSMAFDDTTDRDDFRAPDDTEMFQWIAGVDEAGYVYGQVLDEDGATGSKKTHGPGGPNAKDALIALTVRPGTASGDNGGDAPIPDGSAHRADRMTVQEGLLQNEWLESANGEYRLYLQGDGNLVLRDTATMSALWASGTNGDGGAMLTLNSDGNLVLYTENADPVWASNTAGAGEAELVLENSGALVVYQNGAPVWSVNGNANTDGSGDSGSSGDNQAMIDTLQTIKSLDGTLVLDWDNTIDIDSDYTLGETAPLWLNAFAEVGVDAWLVTGNGNDDRIETAVLAAVDAGHRDYWRNLLRNKAYYGEATGTKDDKYTLIVGTRDKARFMIADDANANIQDFRDVTDGQGYLYEPDNGYAIYDEFLGHLQNFARQLTDLGTPTAGNRVDIRIGQGLDDVEERAGGNMYVDSSDLELIHDRGEDQLVGLRFTGVGVPQGATITRAWVQFTTDETNSEATELTLRGENTDNAAGFSTADYNLSTRPRTAASTYWQPGAWDSVGAATASERTPDIASVIQEIVNRSGWNSGNALALIISGSGERTAESYEGASNRAALLHIEYTEGTSGGDGGLTDSAHKTRRAGVGEGLTTNQWLQSRNGDYRLYLQGDGNLVLRDTVTMDAVWASGTQGQGGTVLVLQSDGNLVLYTDAGQPVWASDTAGSGADALILSDDGTLVLQQGSTTLWAVNDSGSDSGSDDSGTDSGAEGAVRLPIEVLGPAGTTQQVSFEINDPSNITHLYLRCNACGYHDIRLDKDTGKVKASVRVNGGEAIPLKHFVDHGRVYGNQQIKIIGGEADYGGIGGGFRTVRMTVPVQGLKAGTNTLTFEHRDAEAPSLGFRIIALNLLENGSLNRKVLNETDFVMDDPANWTAPQSGAAAIAEGEALWHQRDRLYDPGVDLLDGRGSGHGELDGQIHASCANCHASDGGDLKYFNFSNYSIIKRAQFHGLSQDEGEKIASYIRSLDIPVVEQARPWNPPYQPGPGLDNKPVREWAAGAGIDAVLDRDRDMAPYLFPSGNSLDAVRDVVDRYATLNFRELPINIPMPEWNQWLPLIHPDDAFDISDSDIREDYRGRDVGMPYYRKIYQDAEANPTPSSVGALAYNIKRWLQNSHRDCPTGDAMRSVDGDVLEAISLPVPSVNWGSCSDIEDSRGALEMVEIAKRGLTAWSAVKMWEIMHEKGLEAEGSKLTAPICSDGRCIDASEPRGWVADGRNIFDRAPHFIGTGGGRKFFNQSEMLGIFESNAWYHLNMILNPGYRRSVPSHFAYTYSHVELLQRYSGIDQGYRFWATMIKQRQQQTNGRYGVEAGLDLRTAQPYVYYGTARRTTNTDTQSSVGQPLWGRLAQAMVEDFVEDANNATAEDWAKANHNRKVQPRDSTNFSPCGSRCSFDLGPYQGRNTYRVIPKLREIGVSNRAINDLIDWGEKTWPRGPWDDLR